jgi:hypothetical protein
MLLQKVMGKATLPLLIDFTKNDIQEGKHLEA